MVIYVNTAVTSLISMHFYFKLGTLKSKKKGKLNLLIHSCPFALLPSDWWKGTIFNSAMSGYEYIYLLLIFTKIIMQVLHDHFIVELAKSIRNTILCFSELFHCCVTCSWIYYSLGKWSDSSEIITDFD